MEWKRRRPNEPGLYWNRLEDGTVRPLILAYGSHNELEVNCQGDTELKNYPGQWAGPVVLTQGDDEG